MTRHTVLPNDPVGQVIRDVAVRGRVEDRIHDAFYRSWRGHKVCQGCGQAWGDHGCVGRRFADDVASIRPGIRPHWKRGSTVVRDTAINRDIHIEWLQPPVPVWQRLLQRLQTPAPVQTLSDNTIEIHLPYGLAQRHDGEHRLLVPA